MSDSRLMLVDGSAFLYRAFFAIRELATSGGVPTNAVFGFIRMYRQLVGTWRPTHIAVVFDGGANPRRMGILPEYKANRSPMPAALREQIPMVREFLDLAGVPWVRMEAEEADDVIASLVAGWSDGSGDTLIGTSDKDFFQLVTERIRIVPVSGSGSPMGPHEVMAKTGVPPDRIVDWLALVGDAADNISGVPGVGPKTAARLLTRYGSLDSLREQIHSVESEKLRGALLAYWERIRRNVDLVRLRSDLDVFGSREQWKIRDADSRALCDLFRRLEFHSLEREQGQAGLFDVS